MRTDVPSPRALQRAKQADDRGRRVGSSPKDYERVSKRGPDRLAEALLSRHNRRMLNLSRIPTHFRVEAISGLGPLAVLDPALRDIGIGTLRPPTLYTGQYPRDLAWGVDSAVSVTRLLLAGQTIGAATIARQQLERWTQSLAGALDLSQKSDETAADYIARVWTAYFSRSTVNDTFNERTRLESVSPAESIVNESDALPSGDHLHLPISPGHEICPGELYCRLSEFIHGRLGQDVVAWDTQAMLDPHRLPEESSIVARSIIDAERLCLRQVGLFTAAGLLGQGITSSVHSLCDETRWLYQFSQRSQHTDAREWWQRSTTPSAQTPSPNPSRVVTPELLALMPLMPNEGLSDRNRQFLYGRFVDYESLHAGMRPAGRLFRDDEFVSLAFDAHRYAAIDFARNALHLESFELGDEFNLDILTHRGTGCVLISELASVASLWTEGAVSDALKLVASSFRSAFWLWLEDDDRSMACLRTTLEQSARVVTSIKKPNRARKLESLRAPSPSRWLEAAGWKRLAPLNVALGEYLHAQKPVDPIGPRLLLSALQMEPKDGIDATATARGHALDLVGEFAAHACVCAIGVVSRTVATASTDLLSQFSIDLSNEHREAVLHHALALRAR